MTKCDKCKSTLFSSYEEKYHDCKEFTVYEPCEGDTYVRWGSDASTVAEKIAMDRNNDEPVLNENVFEIPIKITNEYGIEKWFNVYAEPEINYYPSEATAPTEEQLNGF